MTNSELSVYTGQCHCGAVRFEFDHGPQQPDLLRCNCSLCRRKGAVMMSCKVGDFRILSGADVLTLYQWNQHIARHYFCSCCGIYTHHQRRSNPLEIGVNTGCLDDQSVLRFDIKQVNGISIPVV